MKRLAATTLAIGFASACLPFAAGAMSPADIYAKLAPSVWRVQTYDEDGIPLSLGSAVVIAPGMLVTNCHVLARAHRLVVKHEKQTVDAKLTMWDPERDVCQIKAPGLPPSAVAVAMADGTALRVGESVYTLGNPRGLDLTMSEGLLSSIRRNDKEQIVLLQTSASISMGSSGGGLFDDQARLIGLTTLVVGGAKPGEAQSLNFAVPVEWVQQLPQRFARSTTSASAASAASSAPKMSSAEAAIANLMPTSPAAVDDPTKLPRPAVAVSITDDAHLPFSNERMRSAYRQFLTHPSPRTFVVGENGSWHASWRDVESTSPGGLADTTQRALFNCQRRSPTRCLVYAIDDRVVYDPSKR